MSSVIQGANNIYNISFKEISEINIFKFLTSFMRDPKLLYQIRTSRKEIRQYIFIYNSKMLSKGLRC